MNARTQHTDGERLAAIRRGLAAVESRDWRLAYDGNGGFVEALDPMGERIVLLRFEGIASVEEMALVADALDNAKFMDGLIRRAIDKLRPTQPDPDTPQAAPAQASRKNYAAEAGMKCGETSFQVFLVERHGLEPPATPERSAQKLRSLLGVTSRKDLSTDDDAAERWKALRGDYDAWHRQRQAEWRSGAR